jgi:hypothetical protein
MQYPWRARPILQRREGQVEAPESSARRNNIAEGMVKVVDAE